MTGARIAHALPGRVRFSLCELQWNTRSCDALTRALREQPGVRDARANPLCGALVVSFDPGTISLEEIERWLRDSYDPSAARPPSPATKRRTSPLVHLFAGGVAVALAAAGAPFALSAGCTVVSTLPIAVDAIAHLRRGRASVELLDTLAIGVMLAQRMPFGAALSAALIACGEYIRSRTARRSREALLGLFQSTARFAWIAQDERKERVAVERLQLGDLVIIYPGEQIAIDGIVESGTALVDAQVLTGESTPIKRITGDEVFASTLVVDGKIYVRARAVGRATRASQIVHMLEDAPVHDTAIENYSARAADRFVVPALVLGAALFVITRNPIRAAAVIVFDFATAVRISVPTTVLATMAAAVRRNVLIKGGRALERLASVDVIAFDKTGTLTLGAPRVTDIVSLDRKTSESDVLAFAAAAEQRFAHPAAQAIVTAARERNVRMLERETSSYTIGEGVEARVDGVVVAIGSETFFANKSIALPDECDRIADAAAANGASTVFVATDGRARGAISYRDVPRDEAREVIQRLRALGVRVLMITGDSRDVGDVVASQLSIDEVEAQVFPQRKAQIVQELQGAGHVVAVIGDGINDSPALAYADVSLSLKGGSDIARETADIVLHGDLYGLPDAMRLARDAMNIIRQNLGIGVVCNSAGIVVAALGLISPTVATAINNGSAVVAALNGLRPLAQVKGTRHA